MGFVCAAITVRPMMKFESGYTVETVFDGSKLGIEPYSVEVLPSGELLILDSANNNLYRISSSLSLCKWVSFIGSDIYRIYDPCCWTVKFFSTKTQVQLLSMMIILI